MIHLCQAPVVCLMRRVSFCPVCKRNRRFVVEDNAWWGITETCCACGDSWTDGELLERPFKRAWRVESIERAKRMWQNADSPREAKKKFRAYWIAYEEASKF